MPIERKYSETECVLRVEGDLTLRSVQDMQGALIDCLERGTAVTVDVSGVTRTDAAGLQLLCSAHRGFAHRGRPLDIRDGGAEKVSHAAAASGFHRKPGGCDCGSAACFWIGNSGSEQ